MMKKKTALQFIDGCKMIIICVFGAINELECSGKEGKQHGPVCDGVVMGCACFCLLIRSCVLVCMIAKLTLICLFTSHDVRALCNRILCERAGRRSLQEGAQILPQIFLFSLLNRRPMCIRIMGLSAYLRAPPADKQSHTHTRKSRWITGTARAVLGVNFS